MKTAKLISSRRNGATADLGIHRILAPVDFSEAGGPALRYAEALARLTGASVRLLHVTAWTYFATPPYGSGELAYAQFDRERLREVVTRELGALQKALHGIRTSFEIREGVAHREIVAAAKAGRFDLIVIGTHGLSGLEHALLGSTAERVVQHASCPVLVVRPDALAGRRKPTRRREAASPV